MKMTIQSLEYTNIRKFSSLRIPFTSESGTLYKYNFIMMGNGTGKTTTITLLKGLLDGTANNWDATTVRSFRPLSSPASKGTFTVNTLFDDKPYNYILNLDYETGKAEALCSTASQGGLGPRKFPSAIEGLFSEEFVRRFVFDGEQAVKAMDNTSNEAEEAIKYLYRLDVFDDVSRTNRLVLSSIQDEEGGALGTDRSVKNLRSRQKTVNDAIVRLSIKQKELRSIIDQKIRERDEKGTQISNLDKQYNELFAKQTEAKSARDKIRGDLDLSVASILELTKSPYLLSESICLRMFELGDCMTKLKLPKTISKDFFRELANEKTCICGHEIGAAEKDQILKNAEKYLGSDQQSVLNNIKSALMNSSYDNRLADAFAELSELDAALNIADNELLRIEDLLTQAGGEKSKALRDERDALIDEIGRLSEELSVIESLDENNPSLSEENNLNKAHLAFDDLEKKIASATRTNVALHRRDVIEALITEIKEEATRKIKEEIILKTNKKLQSVITDDDIQIESVDRYIKLKNKSGASEGQTLSIAYCFLGTMFEDSELQFPFIIDSPAGKMDYAKRRAVAEILPSLFNQLIAFVTSAEVEQFADQFYDDANSQFTTIIADPTNNAISIHRGKEFFDSYQREHREEEN